jgi:hypothetical protein
MRPVRQMPLSAQGRGVSAVPLELQAILEELAPQERMVMLVLARRLLAGQKGYGRLDLANDKRDWRRERAQELADVLVYEAIAEVALLHQDEPTKPELEPPPQRGK